MKFTLVVLAACACAVSAFVPASMGQMRSMAVFGSGKYDGKVWDKAAKDDVASTYDPAQPWSDTNFDPFKKDANGNSCDPSGYYPGQGRYKDPVRPSVSFAEYQAAQAAKRAAEGN